MVYGYSFFSVNNNVVNDLKLLVLVYWDGKKKFLFVNGYKCDVLFDNNVVIVIEDDDFISLIFFLVG